jgi:transcriptional regulator with XRE-family HTH domain
VETLLAEWVEAERHGRGQTAEEAAAAIGITYKALMGLRKRRAYLWGKTRASLARYLRIPEAMVMALMAQPAQGHGVVLRIGTKTRGRMSALGALLVRLQSERGETVLEQEQAIGLAHTTLMSLRMLDAARPHYDATLETVAAYAGITPAEARVLAHREAETPAGPAVATWIGRKLHPTVRVSDGCRLCPFVEGCREDVLRGDFAWCEDVIEVDVTGVDEEVSRGDGGDDAGWPGGPGVAVDAAGVDRDGDRVGEFAAAGAGQRGDA